MKQIALSQVNIEDIVLVLNESFADYIIPLQLTVEQLKNKIESENIQLNLSVGIMDQEKLVGFMLHALNTIDGQLTAYNAATGVVSSHRGQGIVALMYAWLLEQLKPLAVQQLVLEVIEGNYAAIRTYEKMGYHTARKLICFEGETDVIKHKEVGEIRTLPDFDWPAFQSFWDIQPAWQYTITALENSKSRCHILGAFKKEKLVGYLIFNPTSKRVLQLAVESNQRRKGIASQLIHEMQQITKARAVYVYNIDDRDMAVAAFFKHLDLTSDLAQFEMRRAF
ncbi:GNAT family N-acetyltransferase [Myroides sp. DW712]|uniref:GNAT family N-acetyltransferase n=1 Tax=Myroides sp. DW712 TaxID=3389800 RepID=UPI00397D1B4E